MSKAPRIILIDIETSPIFGMSWASYDTNLLKMVEPSKVISVAYKELYGEKTYCKAVSDYPNYKAGKLDDEKLIKDIWSVLDKSDIVIAHHGDAFDIKKLNARFVYYGLNAPSIYKSIDTLKAAKKYFKFDSNSLDNLSQYLGVGAKMDTGGFSLWLGCIAGDKASWEKMKTYNIHDVVLLEKVYLKLRPFMDNHPNLNVVSDDRTAIRCNACLSENLTKRGFVNLQGGRKQRYQCGDCSSWTSGVYEKYKLVK